MKNNQRDINPRNRISRWTQPAATAVAARLRSQICERIKETWPAKMTLVIGRSVSWMDSDNGPLENTGDNHGRRVIKHQWLMDPSFSCLCVCFSMSFCLSFSLSVCLSVFHSVRPPTHLSICLPVWLFAFQSACLPAWKSVSLSIYPSVSLSLCHCPLLYPHPSLYKTPKCCVPSDPCTCLSHKCQPALKESLGSDKTKPGFKPPLGTAETQ